MHFYNLHCTEKYNEEGLGCNCCRLKPAVYFMPIIICLVSLLSYPPLANAKYKWTVYSEGGRI